MRKRGREVDGMVLKILAPISPCGSVRWLLLLPPFCLLVCHHIKQTLPTYKRFLILPYSTNPSQSYLSHLRTPLSETRLFGLTLHPVFHFHYWQHRPLNCIFKIIIKMGSIQMDLLVRHEYGNWHGYRKRPSCVLSHSILACSESQARGRFRRDREYGTVATGLSKYCIYFVLPK